MKIDTHITLASEAGLLQRFQHVRAHTARLCANLSAEDCMVQSMTDASPVKWHLAHTTWFFETFILSRALPGRAPFHPQFQMLFNSYYVGVGPRQPRPERGVLSRPSLDEVMQYRRATDDGMTALLSQSDLANDLSALIELGLQHEQQHQELILTDLKHHFSRNPLQPAYQQQAAAALGTTAPLTYLPMAGGLQPIGHDGAGFCFDNETPRHQVWLAPYEIGARLVTNAEYLAFMRDGGYRRPELWLSDGWDARLREGWEAPLYWLRKADTQTFDRMFTLSGEQAIDQHGPLCHVSFYEADAYARWAGARLPTEVEWEHAVRTSDGTVLQQAFGEAWQWTNSAYLPYPGFHPAAGAVGEYNGKFMINQMVLRGSSCSTPQQHSRASYRNFFPPHARWQFSGIRLARDK
jgi:ergothioneine biosynthesis protein EgtB